MNLLEWLRKLGIVRYGSVSGKYTSMKDMKTELFMDNVYDAKKDLVHKGDFSRTEPPKVPSPSFCSSCGNPLHAGAKFCTGCGTQVTDAAKSSDRPAAEAARGLAPQSKGMGCGRIILIAVAVGFFILLGLYILGSMGNSNDAPPVAAADAPDAVSSSKPSLKQQAPDDTAATGFQFARYPNQKFGFETLIPSHWESEVKDNSQVFSAPRGGKDYGATFNWQVIRQEKGASLDTQADELITEMQDFSHFILREKSRRIAGGKQAVHLLVSFETAGGEPMMMDWLIVDKLPYFFWFGYTAPTAIFEKYEEVASKAASALKFAN